MKYISFFSGMGGFEVAIQRVIPNAECVGYSEISPSAIKLYESHYSNHRNLGDIRTISKKTLKSMKCDLVVAGFPCQNLTSMSRMRGENSGVQGEQSGLFFELIRVLKVLEMPHIIIENNASMKQSDRDQIHTFLFKLYGKRLHMTFIDSASMGVQSRKRLYWTSFPYDHEKKQKIQKWKDVLEPVNVKFTGISKRGIGMLNRPTVYGGRSDNGWSYVAKYSKQHNAYFFSRKHTGEWATRWFGKLFSDTCTNQNEVPYRYNCGKAKVLMRDNVSNIVLDRRGLPKGFFNPRRFTKKEIARLFGYPDDYFMDMKYWPTSHLAGNSVVVYVIEDILHSFLRNVRAEK